MSHPVTSHPAAVAAGGSVLSLPQGPPDLLRLDTALQQSAALHGHLCPRQILGARSAVLAGDLLGLDFPRTDKRVLVLAETDGCYADGVSAASGCWLGRRTLRLMDYGRVAATFVDTRTGRALRVWPRTDLRERVRAQKPPDQKRYQAYLDAYRHWSDAELLRAAEVELDFDLAALISQAGAREVCSHCGEEVLNERWSVRQGRVLCPACLGGAYYRPTSRQDNL
ncbi:FmdE family protein [Deinococcus radiophilus]|uniref:Formylmethanofuran dehydrogenase n=1 Tax=Deinococcus radiophilus TaxID=32062 RepID=A0A431W5I4_9DEIO|nr:FmdE family protein [Deinococcus radiophilus]RTR30681.1 formylmethanofuran dehydrogenase [Deinococcus radiophilus]UFA51233.1 FmdE family protein [Deinococcus radiophilus]